MKAELLIKKIKRAFPEINFTKTQHITDGWDHDVIILDNKIVFRFPKKSDNKKGLINEEKLLQYLEKKITIPIPNYRYIAKNSSFAGYDIIKGKQFTVAAFKKISAEMKNTIAKELATFLTQLHTLPMSSIAKLPVKKFNESIDPHTLPALKKLIFPKITATDQENILNYYKELKLKKAQRLTSCLTHRDLVDEHIYFLPNQGLTGIIDFSDYMIDDPAQDFAGLWCYGKDFVKNVYRLYKGKKDVNFLYRSKLRSKSGILWTMIDSQSGYNVSFKQSYKLFKQTF